MLFYVRPDQQVAGSDVHVQIRDLVNDCASEGLLLIVELLTYRLDDEDEATYHARFPQLVVEAARLGATAGAKILKLPYPGSREASAAVTSAADGVPWAVLSAGVDHDTFAGQVAEAVKGEPPGPWPDGRSGRTASPPHQPFANPCSPREHFPASSSSARSSTSPTRAPTAFRRQLGSDTQASTRTPVFHASWLVREGGVNGRVLQGILG